MKRLSILIADETPAVCWLLRRWLPNHHITCVHSAKEALNASRLLRFELVVGDPRLAKPSEPHFFDQLKQRQPWIRLLALSSADGSVPNDNAFQRSMQLGAHAAVMKPMRERQFMLALRACWNDSVPDPQLRLAPPVCLTGAQE